MMIVTSGQIFSHKQIILLQINIYATRQCTQLV